MKLNFSSTTKGRCQSLFGHLPRHYPSRPQQLTSMDDKSSSKTNFNYIWKSPILIKSSEQPNLSCHCRANTMAFQYVGYRVYILIKSRQSWYIWIYWWVIRKIQHWSYYTISSWRAAISGNCQWNAYRYARGHKLSPFILFIHWLGSSDSRCNWRGEFWWSVSKENDTSGMLKPVIIEADDATAQINTIFLQEQPMGVGCCIRKFT